MTRIAAITLITVFIAAMITPMGLIIRTPIARIQGGTGHEKCMNLLKERVNYEFSEKVCAAK